MRACLFVFCAIMVTGCAGVHPSTPAPTYELTPRDRAEIAQVDHDLAAHGQVPGLAVDRPAVVSHFLRATCKPGHDAESWNKYRIHMCRLLNRMFWAKQVDWSDPRLDWDVWNAYAQLERVPEREWPKWSAWQLVLRHLWKNADAIAESHARTRWWLDRILDGSRSPRRATLVCFLVSCLDKRSIRKTHAIRKFVWPMLDAFRGYGFQLIASSPSWPVVQVPSYKLPAPLRSFEGALDALAYSIGYDWEAWGFDADRLPAPRLPVQSATPVAHFGPPSGEPFLDERAWGDGRKLSTRLDAFGYYGEPDSWQPWFDTTPPRAGKVVLFSNNGTLLCWPRLRMPDAALKLAVRAGLLTEADLPEFYARGYQPLDVTVSGGR
jgi:hypothetical protein